MCKDLPCRCAGVSPARPAVAPYHQVRGGTNDVLRLPGRLRFNKINSVLHLVALALPRIELESTMPVVSGK
jgi:hypothetical protein